ncbi:lysis system i-spanin subunit Rz [Massilia rhizosphaerae]|uniref:lysis system i-spanin subunit Rz n=1 Tax=Massilia rhizosphaerae TaxID=2784389 RepID=UPI0018DC44ED|nr:lysis system i-spanin subunit Rz [Massilia rhizosphaerae]
MIAALLLRFGIPRWAAIAVLCAISAGAALAYRAHLIDTGIAIESARRDKIDTERDRQAKAELAEANARVRNAQAELDGAIATVAKLQTELTHEQANSAALQSDLAAGRRRLSVAITGSCRPAQAEQAAGAAAAGVDPGTAATADLDPAAAASLAGLTAEGDSAIVRLNACIAAYDAVKTASDAQ